MSAGPHAVIVSIGRARRRLRSERGHRARPSTCLTGGSRYGHGSDAIPPRPSSSARRCGPGWRTTCPPGWFDDGFEMSARGAGRRSTTSGRHKLYGGGWICATWPKEYGGKGLSTMEGVVLAEEFARAKAPMRADFFGDTLVGPTLLQWGTEEQKREFLPQILRGEMRWCQGFSEPNSGSDLASLKTSAVLDGDEWVINGQKVWTTGGHHADYCFLLTRTDPGRPEAQGHLLPARADAPARRRGARHHPARRHGRVLRGVLRRRPLPEGQRRRRRQQRLEGRQLDARRSSAASRRRPATGASRRSTARWSPRPRENGAHRRPAHPPAAGAVLHEDPDPAHQRPALAVGDAVGRQGPGRRSRSARRTRCSGRRCTSGRWSWPSTSTAPSSMLDRHRPGERLVARRAARQAPRRATRSAR